MHPSHVTRRHSTPLVASNTRAWLAPTLRRVSFRHFSTPSRPLGRAGLRPQNPRARVVASSAKDGKETKKKARYKATLLNVLDGASMLGTVGGAVAVLLGADIMIITLPVVLPFVSLAIGRSKEKARVAQLVEAEEEVKQELKLQREQVSDMQESVLDVGDDLDKKLSERLVKLEEKMGAMEGTIITTGSNVRQLVSGLKSMPKMLRRMAELQQQAVVYGISGELQSILERWGAAQLQEIDAIGARLRYLEDAVRRLELSAREQPAQVITDEATQYRYSDRVVPVEPLPLDDSSVDTPFLTQAKESVVRDMSGLLEELKNSQADMLRSIQDMAFNQSMSESALDFSLLEGQLTDLTSQLGSLPSKMSDGVRQELGMFSNYKADIALQLSAVSRALQTLERVVLDMREDSAERSSREIVFEQFSGNSQAQFEELQAGVYTISQDLQSMREALFDFKNGLAWMDPPPKLESTEGEVEAVGVSSAQSEESLQGVPWLETNGSSALAPGKARGLVSTPDTPSDDPEAPNGDSNKGTRVPPVAGVFSEKVSPTVLEFMPPMESPTTPPPTQPAYGPRNSASPDYAQYPSQSSSSPSDGYSNYASPPAEPRYEQFAEGANDFRQDVYGDRESFESWSQGLRQPGKSDPDGVYNDGGIDRNEGFGSPFPDDARRWGNGDVSAPSFVPNWNGVADPMGPFEDSNAPGYPSPSLDPRTEYQERLGDFAQRDEQNYQEAYRQPGEPYDSRVAWDDQPQVNGRTDFLNGGGGAGASELNYREQAGTGPEPTGGYPYVPAMDSMFPEEGQLRKAGLDNVAVEAGGSNGDEVREAGALAKAGDNGSSDMLVQGLGLLKEGRKAVDTDFGDAYRLLCEALDCFELKLEEEPGNVKALGNCGNVLLALGELKVQMVESLLEGDPALDGSRNSQALTQLKEEAQQFLTLSGQKFKMLLEVSPDDERGYMNWAKALNTRAKLTTDPGMKDRLFNAAAVKYEQVLSMRPDFPAGVLAYASVLKDWASSKPERDITAIELMQQAIACLEDVLRNPSSDSIKEEAAFSKQEFERILGSMSEM